MADVQNRQLVETLFKTIKALCATEEIITDYTRYSWYQSMEYIHSLDIKSEYIHFYSDETNDKILSIQKPQFEPCPAPDSELTMWLKPGWNAYKADVGVHEHLEYQKQFFNDSHQRVTKYQNWLEKRNVWVQRQQYLEKIERLFVSFNRVCDFFRLDSEQYELLFAFGVFKDLHSTEICHPLFTKRIKIEYNDIKNNIITLYDMDSDVHFDSAFLTKIQNASVNNFDKINSLLIDDCSIFDEKHMKELLKHAIHFLSTQGEYFEHTEKFYGNNRFIVTYEPMVVLRLKSSGMAEFIDKIIEHIQNGGAIPQHLVALLNPKNIQVDITADEVNETIDKRLAAVSGEDPDIYMTKPANREQLRIAREIEKHAAVEVQGPPGTGKTHTIANLIGHFLAQGKTLLVTSEKVKALTVLRDKLDDEIKPLCLPVFYDNQNEMQHSVNAILSKQGETSVGELKRKITQCQKERTDIISRLNAERQAVFNIRHKEAQNIVFDHKSYSVMEAAQFVNDNKNLLSVIPGTVRQMDELPLGIERFKFIYQSSENISLEDEHELSLHIPDYHDFMLPDSFCTLLATIRDYNSKEATIAEDHEGTFDTTPDGTILYAGDILFGKPDRTAFSELLELIKAIPDFVPWQQQIIADSFIGSGYEQRWNKLVEKIDKYCLLDKQFVGDAAGNHIEIVPDSDLIRLQAHLPEVIEKFKNEGKIGSFYRMFHSDVDYVLKQVTFNGNELTNSTAAGISLEKIKCELAARDLKRIWNDLFDGDEVAQFDVIKGNKAIFTGQIARKIRDALDWQATCYEPIKNVLESMSFNMNLFGQSENFVTEIDKRLEFLTVDLREYVEIALIYDAKKSIQMEIEKAQERFQTDILFDSILCQRVFDALEKQDSEAYKEAYLQYKNVYDKLSLYEERMNFLNELTPYAEDWAKMIKKREGLQAKPDLPCDLVKAWKVKQLNEILEELFSESIEKRQKNILEYGKDLRKKTSEMAGLMAWMHLLQRLDGQQAVSSALNAWSSLMRKIGKGKGKMVSSYRQSARINMLNGQSAVPAWIIPVKKVLETFNPVRNHFDVAIVDEASQSSLEALAITFMADKIIVVGDDKQVSPMLVGTDIEPRKAILLNYLKPYTENWTLFDGRTSFYELVGTVFQPLMLREHFRCVPEIIGYSNEKFYNNQILPLRDSNQCRIFPPVINYRVDGKREGKHKLNYVEADVIVSLIQACCEQDEYSGKTFGVISMIGDEQPEYINSLLSKHIADYGVIKERELICGNSASFQGDERDVMFLCMVDDNSTVRKASREDDAKRYNVAASRAKDQLWVVNSLDYSLLQQDDLHYGLLEYAENYQTHMQNLDRVKEQSESVFEEEVAKYLLARGYHITQQYAVGAYRLDIVVHYKTKKIAIECDGQRYHSGEEKICQDMERQCILERLGYSFIRIGGGQFYRDKDAAMELVFCQLEEAGIYPEKIDSNNSTEKSELLQRVIRRAYEIRMTWNDDNIGADEMNRIEEHSDSVSRENQRQTKKYSIEEESASPVVAAPTQTPMQVKKTATLPKQNSLDVYDLAEPISLFPSSNTTTEGYSEHHTENNKSGEFKGSVLTKRHKSGPAVALGDTIAIKSISNGEEKRYKMMNNQTGHLTELASVCIGRRLNDIVEYQGKEYKIISVVSKK